MIFRGNTFATKAVDTYMKMVGEVVSKLEREREREREIITVLLCIYNTCMMMLSLTMNSSLVSSRYIKTFHSWAPRVRGGLWGWSYETHSYNVPTIKSTSTNAFCGESLDWYFIVMDTVSKVIYS